MSSRNGRPVRIGGGRRNDWLRRLDAHHLLPDLLVLEWTTDPEAEARWIRRYLENGANLLNETANGKAKHQR